MQQNKVTYVINTYNRQNKLINAIESVLDQKGISLEVLVVDDCSSGMSVEGLIEKYPTVKFYRNAENIGLSRSRQVGLELCRTEYVAFLDDDDVLVDEYKTLRQLKILQLNESAAVVCSDIIEFDGISYKDGDIQWPGSLLNHLMKRNGIIYPSTTTCRKKHLLGVGGFDYRFKRGVDSDVYRRLVLAGHDILFESKKTIHYLVEAKDKITDNQSSRGLFRNIVGNALTIRKYYTYYLKNLDALLFRLKAIAISLYLIFKNKLR